MRRPSARLRLVAVVLAGVVVLGTTAGAGEAPVTKGKPPVRLVVLFDRSSSTAAQDRAVDGAGTELRTVASLDARVLEVPGARARAVHQRLLADDSVRSVEVDAPRSIAEVVPNESALVLQPSLGQVDLPEAWDYTTGSSSTVIAIIDTGVDGVSPDLPRSRFVAPFNVLTGTANVGDVEGHGTAIASIAGMTGNNGRQAVGGCWSCAIMPIKALASDGSGLASDVAVGIVWAVDHGADVINLSLSGPSSGIEKAAVDYAESHGVVVVAAAGNQASSTPRYPAAHPTVLGVAASGPSSDGRESYSNFGSWVKLAAPGTNVAVDAHSVNLLQIQGTSSASPVVAGIAGLLRSEQPGLSPAQVRAALMNSAVDVAYVSSSGGRVDADGALAAVGAGLTAAPGPTTGPVPSLDLNPTDELGGGVTSSGVVTKTISGVRAGTTTFKAVCAFCGGLTVEILNSGGSVVASQAGGRSVTVSTTLASDGTYRFRLRGQRGGVVGFLVTYNQ